MMLHRTNDRVNFEMALGMLLEPNPLRYDLDQYFKAASEIGMTDDLARLHLSKCKRELGIR